MSGAKCGCGGSGRWAAAAAVAMALLLGWLPAAASKLMYLPLEEVVRAETVVFAAKVTRVERSSTEQHSRIDYELTGVRPINGEVPSALARTFFTRVIPIIRDASGKVVGRFSPILPASGQEGKVTAGTTWLFFSNGTTEPVSVFRVEPAGLEPVVRELLGKAGATPVPVEAEPEPVPDSQPDKPFDAPPSGGPAGEKSAGGAPQSPRAQVANAPPPVKPSPGCGGCAAATGEMPRRRAAGTALLALILLLGARRRMLPAA